MHSDQTNNPYEVDIWFPPQYRKPYVEHLIGLSYKDSPAFTPSQAEYFVRLWGYGYLQQEGARSAPIEFLSPNIKPFRCSYREAADLFYGKDERESRSGGNMLDKFCSMQFARRKSSSGAGNRSRIRLMNLEGLILPNHRKSQENHQQNKIYAAQFDTRNDREDAVTFVDALYALDPNFPDSVQKNIKGGLKAWAKRYPQGMRVIRYVDHENGKPEETIGLVAVFPVHEESENVFDESPRNSFYLGTFSKGLQDPIRYAEQGDECESACIRCWQLKPERWTLANALLLFNETQSILREMHGEYPDLEIIYSIPIHETLQKFALSIGFKLKRTRNQQDLYWLYIELDRFLAIDGDKALENFDFRNVSFS